MTGVTCINVERRNHIMKILSLRRQEKISNLAYELGVSERTIRRDIEILSLSEPIYTQPGRYTGGVCVIDGYYDNKTYMSVEESAVLQHLCDIAKAKEVCLLTDEEFITLKKIIKNYSKPLICERTENERKRKTVI